MNNTGQDLFSPLVSIVIPVYNGANYMREAIDSAINQTYKNVEVIVVNDGSSDNTEEIAKSYGDRISYYSKPNGGVASALNLGVNKARGSYVSWLSHDDVYELTKIEKQIAVIKDLPKNSRLKTVLYGNFSLINEESKEFFTKRIELTHDFSRLSNPYYAIFNGLVHGCSMLIPKKCISAAGMFDEKLIVTQDYDLWFRMLPKYKLIFIEDSLIKSRVHSEQGSKTIKSGETERNEGWINRIKSLSEEQIKSIAYTKTNFLNTARIHFQKAQYHEVVNFLDEMIRDHSSREIGAIKVSIIIPFHNRIDWVKQALSSVVKQTHENLEILLINDHSTDSIEELKELVGLDERVRLLTNSNARGAGGARNTGLEHARGDYISFLDSDDFFETNKIEDQLRHMVKNNLAASHTSYTLFDDNGRKNRKKINSGSKNYTYPNIIAGCTIACPTVMIEEGIVSGPNLTFQEEYLNGQDVCFWIDVAKITAIEGIDKYLTFVRIHDSNVAYNTPKLIRGMTNIHDYVVREHLNKNTAEYVARLTGSLQRTILKLSNDGGNIPLKHLVTESSKNVSLKNRIKSLIRKLLKKYHITYRAVTSNRERLDSLLMSSETQSRSNSQILNQFNSLLSITDELKNELFSIKRNVQFNKQDDDALINLYGQPLKPTKNIMNKPIVLNLKSAEFHQTMRDKIARTNVVLDIGVGLKPQMYFEPNVHICVEPFKQYRDIVKPFTSGRGNIIFLKDGALESLAIMDDNSVDSVFMLDLIEHLEKREGKILLEEADRVSRKQIIVYTPLGFYPMHFNEENEHDAWGLDGNELQEHKSGWTPEDFGKGWEFFVCKDCHPAFLEEEKKKNIRYSALMAIRTKRFSGHKVVPKTPSFVKQRSALFLED